MPEDTSIADDIKGLASRVLGNIVFANDTNKVAIAAAGAIPLMVELLRVGSDEVKAGVAWALANFTMNNAANKVAIVRTGAIPLLVDVLRGGSDEGKAGAASALAGLMAGNDAHRAAIMAAGAISLVPAGGAVVRLLGVRQGARCSGTAEPRRQRHQ